MKARQRVFCPVRVGESGVGKNELEHCALSTCARQAFQKLVLCGGRLENDCHVDQVLGRLGACSGEFRHEF